jgi:photosystem II stability/assembly factor-like uncharacterized protein
MKKTTFSFLCCLFLSFLLLSLSSVGQAQITDSLTWIPMGGPPGGLGYDIRYNFADPDIWYVTDGFAGVHISTDNGMTWQPSNTGIPPQIGPTGDGIPVFSLTVDPHNPQIVWAGTDRTGHIYRSTDGGHTWQQRENGISIDHDAMSFRGFTVDPRTSDIVYAMAETTDEALGGPNVWGSGTGGSVYKTTDAGENWTRIWNGDPPSSLARYMWINPQNPDVLYVSTGIFDRGAVGEGDPLTDPFGGIGILKSTDGGQTWSIQNEEQGLRMLYLGSLFMHPENPDILLAAAGHTTEGGSAEYLQDLVGQGIDSPVGIYRTSNGGQNWTQVFVSNERFAESFAAVEFCLSDPNIAYAGSEVAIYRSEDAGETWQLVNGGSSPWGPPGVNAGWPIDMQCDPRDPNRIFVNNYTGGNFLSEDGGRTWQNASQGYTGAQVHAVTVDPADPASVYAVGRSGPWRSNDGGTTWTGLYYPPADYVPSNEYGTIALDPIREGHLLAGNSPGAAILESEDNGQTWHYRWPGFDEFGEPRSDIGGDVTAIVFAPSNPDIVYAGMADGRCALLHEPCQPSHGVVISRDGGTTWEQSMDEHVREVSILDLAVDPTDAEIVFAATETGLYRSTDGSKTWTSVNDLPDGTRVWAVTISPNDRDHILTGIDQLGVFASGDGGLSWQESYAGLEPNNSLHDIVFDPTNTQTVYVSDNLSGVYRSTDGGGMWLKINDGLRMRAALGLAISGDGRHLYASTNGEGVYRLDLSGVPVSVDITKAMSTEYCLEQNYPNPFNSSTTIEFSVPKKSKVDIKIYNAFGQEIFSLVKGEFESGKHSVVWNGHNKNTQPASTGLYFVTMKTDNFIKTKKILLLK